ncbi:O-antigen ligase family protein [Hydrogenophaga pseudoflava]|uniref:O-antigen ligase family protein n=1 Tax=Hydrogenophaga pseudoflava TaxID=47421 RepID=UPI0027E55DA4|nr:O-antigen ligase family protein [Hydrogenophaga pseudoflava]MDQ7746413.1 O-antigen ligase family protein [Hydrogenophaga pseudoflava]
MAEHVRALIVLLALSLVFFQVARGAMTQLIPEATYKRWRNLWVAATLVLFLSNSVWVCILVTGALLLVYRRREEHVMGLYFVLLFVSPPVPAEIPGLGIIDHLWVLDHYRLLGVTLLLPVALVLLQRSSTSRIGSSPVDWWVLGYLSLMSMLAFRPGNITSGLRTVLTLWVDIFLPYYVASRSIRNEEGFRQAMTGFVIASMILSLVAIFEMLRNWKLYSAVLGALGVNEWMFGGYLMRSGFLRPNATVGNSIVLGYVLVVALGFFLYLKEFLSTSLSRFLGLALLTGGIVASLSRGPWIGCLLLVATHISIGPKALKRLSILMLSALIAFSVMSLIPSGQRLIDMLPIIGTSDQGNVEYRANLIASALPVIERHLLLGSFDFLSAPELQVMMQGEKIIDVVNSYVGAALYSGIIGLTLFAGIFISALHQLRKHSRDSNRASPKAEIMGRALFSTVLATMFIIYTVSSIIAIPVVYWPLVGMCVAFSGMIRDQARRFHEPVRRNGAIEAPSNSWL